MKKILIVNEQPLLSEGLRKLLELKFVGFYRIQNISIETLERFKSEVPSLIILESTIDRKTQSLLATFKTLGTKIIIISQVEILRDFNNYQLFSGFLLKDMKTQHMLQVIEEIIESEENFVHPEVGNYFFQEYLKLKA